MWFFNIEVASRVSSQSVWVDSQHGTRPRKLLGLASQTFIAMAAPDYKQELNQFLQKTLRWEFSGFCALLRDLSMSPKTPKPEVSAVRAACALFVGGGGGGH